MFVLCIKVCTETKKNGVGKRTTKKGCPKITKIQKLYKKLSREISKTQRTRGPLSFRNFRDHIPQVLDVEQVLYFNRLKLDT